MELVAVIVGVFLGSGLTALTNYLNNRDARQRAEQQAEREAQIRREEWERQERVRKDEQEQEQKRRRNEDRIRSYKQFVAATTFDFPLAEHKMAEQLLLLNESHTEVQFYASDLLSINANNLYDAAVEAIEDRNGVTSYWDDLNKARQAFWTEARDDLAE